MREVIENVPTFQYVSALFDQDATNPSRSKSIINICGSAPESVWDQYDHC
jgi:hypothetical protein